QTSTRGRAGGHHHQGSYWIVEYLPWPRRRSGEQRAAKAWADFYWFYKTPERGTIRTVAPILVTWEEQKPPVPFRVQREEQSRGQRGNLCKSHCPQDL